MRYPMRWYPFRIVGTDPETGKISYFGGARTQAAAEKRAHSYNNSKHAIRLWKPIRVLTDAEFAIEMQAQEGLKQ